MVRGNVLFNDTLNTFYLRLYGVGSVVTAFAHGAMGCLIDPSWWSEMYLRGKSVRSWCDGSLDRSFMEERDVAPW